MDSLEVLDIISKGEDSSHQFKVDIANTTSLAGDMAAFSNTNGGMILIGVDDNNNIVGLSNDDIRRINQLISNTATSNIKNPINPISENIIVGDKKIIVVKVEEGLDKPYLDNEGAIWVKSGSDKRRVTSKEELRRLFQSSDIFHADEIPVHSATIEELDLPFFKDFCRIVYSKDLDHLEIPMIQFLENIGIAKNQELNLTGLLVFSKYPQKFKPQFIIKAVSYDGNDIAGTKYRDSEDISGKIQNQYSLSLSFVKRNLKKIQTTNSFNTQGEMEIPEEVFEELLANALMHRDYFVSAPIRLFIFDNRVEIISPGILPNNLTVENIKSGVSNIRNPILTSFITKNNLIKYRGMGTGIIRALNKYPEITFTNERDNNQFRVVIQRPLE
ncbi:MAG: RNA-binding domain-containing protein [Bacteroidota bacterium]